MSSTITLETCNDSDPIGANGHVIQGYDVFSSLPSGKFLLFFADS